MCNVSQVRFLIPGPGNTYSNASCMAESDVSDCLSKLLFRVHYPLLCFLFLKQEVSQLFACLQGWFADGFMLFALSVMTRQ